MEPRFFLRWGVNIGGWRRWGHSYLTDGPGGAAGRSVTQRRATHCPPAR